METWDVIVVGLGAMGSATVHQLARRGARVLGIDAYSPPHTVGSTHGDSRITRQAIGEGFAYVPLVQRSNVLWRFMEEEAGTDLLTQCGGLILGRVGSDHKQHGKTDFLGRTIAAAEKFGITHDVLTTSEAQSRFPQFTLHGDETGYYEPGAGYLRPERCVATQLTLAKRHGATLRFGERLTSFRQDGVGARITTDTTSYAAGAVVLSAGPWITQHLSEPLQSVFTVNRQAMHWYDISPDGFDALSKDCPVYIWESTPETSFYGFPAIDGPSGGLKMATEATAEVTTPEDVNHIVPEAESLQKFDDVFGPRFPGIERRVIKAVTCLYTTTSDGDFVIDAHPDAPAVLVVSPCSGHGFKHSAAIGEAVTEKLLDGEAAIDLSAFAFSRFGALKAEA